VLRDKNFERVGKDGFWPVAEIAPARLKRKSADRPLAAKVNTQA